MVGSGEDVVGGSGCVVGCGGEDVVGSGSVVGTGQDVHQTLEGKRVSTKDRKGAQ